MAVTGTSTIRAEPCGLTLLELQSLPDEELMCHLQAGHHDALAIALDRYQRLVWTIARRILGDEGEAQDVVQIVFLEFFRKLALFDASRGTLKVWLSRIAFARSINRRYHLERRRFYRQVEMNEEEVEQYRAAENAPALRLNSCETALLAREALGTLNPTQRRTIEKVCFEGLTLQELAERTGETLASVKHQYYRGIVRLRRCLADRETE